MASTQPVTKSTIRAVRGSVIGPDTSRRVRIWELTLACGHTVERVARYQKPIPGAPRANGWHPRSRSELLPAPKSCRCTECPDGVTAKP